MSGWRKRGKGIKMIEEFKELNIADVFTLRYERTADGYYQQTYTEEEFNTMQEWLDRALGEYTQSMEVENSMLRARNERLEALTQPEQEPVAGVFDYKEHAEGLQRDYDLLLAEYNNLKAQRTWVGLTDEQMWKAYTGGSDIINLDYAKSIVALFKEKNT